MRPNPSLLKRSLALRIDAALSDTPVVMVVGPRQAGKTTLCRQMGASRGARFLTFDDGATLAAAEADPGSFTAALDGPVILDEIQRVPRLLPAIKLAVDRKRTPGRFLLTGSANVLTLPKASESLTGRVEVLTLWPLSQGELEEREERFVDAVFGRGRLPVSDARETRASIVRRAVSGGYPAVRTRERGERRDAWFGSYVTTILQRDVRDLAAIEGLTAMLRLLALIAARAASLLNVADLSRGSGLPHSTLARYLALLEQTFLICLIPAWMGRGGRRLLKAPRLVLADAGLLAHLAGLNEERLVENPSLAGPLLENFVAMELIKQLGWSRIQAGLLHFRTYAGREVDFVLESADGRIVGIEVKAAATVAGGDFDGLRALQETAGRRFHRGIVLYTGEELLPFGPSLWAMPMSTMWTVGAAERS